MSIEPWETVTVQIGDFTARGVKLTHGNLGPTTAWAESEYLCSGPVDNNQHVNCHLRLEEKDGTVTRVDPGEWVVLTDNGFKKYPDDQVRVV